MSLLKTLASRALDAVDIAFDALGALRGVLLRGSFTPDARSYRSSRFAPIAPPKLWVQKLELNAGDSEQARKIIDVEPDKYLPLDSASIVFDLVGPIDPARIRPRPEQSFLLAVARKDTLERLRADLPRGRRWAIEAFSYSPPDAPNSAFCFADDAGRKQRRMRRLAIAVAFCAFTLAANDAYSAWRSALERSVAEMDTQRVQAERRVRLLERRQAQAQTWIEATNTTAPSLALVSTQLSRLATRQPASSEINAISLSGVQLAFSGRSHDPYEFELELRRGFETSALDFSTLDGPTPQAFEARLDRFAESADP